MSIEPQINQTHEEKNKNSVSLDDLATECEFSKFTSLDKNTFQDIVRYHFQYSLGKEWSNEISHDLFQAVSLAIRDKLIDCMIETEKRYNRVDSKRLYYLSMEFLVGRSLSNNLFNLGIHDFCENALAEIGVDLGELEEVERDAALGNGGLGRLASCFLDSLASLNLPGYGYGINYEYGLFKQGISNGFQKEKPDNWLHEKSPWLIEKQDEICLVPLYGTVDHGADRSGQYNPMWMNWKVVVGVPHDMPIVGYSGRTVNVLRLYSARSAVEFDMNTFNSGNYYHDVEKIVQAERISKVLYPADHFPEGKELRLIQEYFLLACSVRDIFRKFKARYDDINLFPEKVAIQMNDTHPALTVAELMRLLVDENDLTWETAWSITTRTLAFTNHTLLPEALEKWSLALLEKVLPRHTQIIYEINHRFLQQIAERWPGDTQKMQRLSIFEEGPCKQARMAHLAIIGSHSVNGVAELHSELIKSDLVPEFYEMWPEKFNNKTNGITQRRWLLKSNPNLADLVTSILGDMWITDLYKLKPLLDYADDASFQREFLRVKRDNKKRLANYIRKEMQLEISPDSLFDIQCKRFHEYKRQLLNIMSVIHQYFQILDGVSVPVSRTCIFSGKAAPGYFMAKLIIKFINNVSQIINNDERVKGQLKVAFVPNYCVSLAERLIPAADLSEQISLAGTEASGTGNMKFALNGALTIGTWDGANIEISEEVGSDNIYIFGQNEDEVAANRVGYNPHEEYENNEDIKRVIDAIRDDAFSKNEPGIFKPIIDSILADGDHYMLLKDFESYISTQEKVSLDFNDKKLWARMAINNMAGMGKFSSDRTIREYAGEIWKISPA